MAIRSGFAGALVFALGLMGAPAAFAEGDVYLRVVDVGPGLCVIAHTPDGWDMLYDAGHWQSDQCTAAVEEIVADDNLELVVISHSDGDHLGELPEILAANGAGVILHTGSGPRDSAAWNEAMTAIGGAAADGSTVINLANTEDEDGDGVSDEIGSVYELGEAEAAIIAGWHEWDLALSDSDALPEEAERLNAISIVVRFAYNGHSVLLTGDTIGRRIGDDAETCRDAEKWMVAHADLDSDVLIAPHHGGDNGSCADFLREVSPRFVVYSAGHQYRHPRQSSAMRAHDPGIGNVPWNNMFRTDRGDDERDPRYSAATDVEWGRWRRNGNIDPRGDNTIEICLPGSASGAVRVRYRDASTFCGVTGVAP